MISLHTGLKTDKSLLSFLIFTRKVRVFLEKCKRYTFFWIKVHPIIFHMCPFVPFLILFFEKKLSLFHFQQFLSRFLKKAFSDAVILCGCKPNEMYACSFQSKCKVKKQVHLVCFVGLRPIASEQLFTFQAFDHVWYAQRYIFYYFSNCIHPDPLLSLPPLQIVVLECFEHLFKQCFEFTSIRRRSFK